MNTPAPDQQANLWRPPFWLGTAWGFAEGTLFFIVPDVLLAWASLSGLRCGAKTLAGILAGALLAGGVMYGWASARPEASRAAVASVPFVRESMFDTVQHDYRKQGLRGMLNGPSSGIPYKVYAVLAPPLHQPLTFLFLSIPARMERLALSWLVFTAIGQCFRRSIARHSCRTTALFLLFWTFLYTWYWSRI